MAAGEFIIGLRCLRCGMDYAPGAVEYVCACRPDRGSDLGTLDVLYDYAAIGQTIRPADIARDADRSIGRYWPLLPIDDRVHLPPLPVGNTPLLRVDRLGAGLGLRHLYVKDDGRNPSGSLKDRASAIAVTRAQEASYATVATASTGNAAAALAGQCAAAGQPNVIFVPKSAPQAKIAQLLVFGSQVLAIDGSYDQAFDLCLAACAEFGWYNRNTGYNPYMTEGKKTVAFEIAEQLGVERWLDDSNNSPGNGLFVAPDAVFVSVGDGSIIGGVYKGFKDLLSLGWIEKLPRIYGVQSTQSAALYAAWRNGKDLPDPVRASTRADSISVDAPRDAVKALRAVRESNGAYLAVPDSAILRAILPLARRGAVFAEPAGAAAYAGLEQAVSDRLVTASETIVVINTGNGLKDVGAAMQVAGRPTIIPATMDAVRAAISRYS